MVSYDDWELHVSDIKGKMDRGELIPDPDWQRGYIWKLRDEQLLIDSILRGMPIPKFYLTEEYNAKKGASVHYVVDGQQRLRAIYRFLDNRLTVDWNGGQRFFSDLDAQTQKRITTYKLNGHYMRDYSQPDINFLFQRLNRTGIKLTNMEVWNNEFYDTPILKMVKDIEQEHKGFFEDIIYTEENVLRKLPLDDIIDLCHCLMNDRVEAGSKEELAAFLKQCRDISPAEQIQVKSRFRKIIRNLEGILSKDDLQSSQYGKRTHFTSVFLAMGLLISEYYILPDPQQLRLDLLAFIQNQPAKYRKSVLGAIRKKDARTARVTALQKVIRKRAKRLDGLRCFPEALKQKLWQQDRQCQICMKPISVYKHAAVDHVEPWAKGGRTIPKNGQLAHRSCNQKKQAKTEEFILAPN